MADIKIEMAQDEVDEIIRNKRKARDPKACYACHRRKVSNFLYPDFLESLPDPNPAAQVKCDRGSPCESCIKRDHPELCSYERPSKRRQLALNRRLSELDRSERVKSPSYSPPSTRDTLPSQSGVTISVPKEQWDKMNQDLRTMQETINNLRMGIDTTVADESPVAAWNGAKADDSEREGIHAPSGILGTMHLGSRSVLAYMMGLGRKKSSQEATTTLLQDNVLPKLGLDNETSIYPFVDLWSSDASAWDVSALCKTLPDDDLCREFFSYYRDVACTIYPVISDTMAFEAQLNILLQNRSFAGGEYVPTDENNLKPFGVTLSWLALLFAVIASGSQSSDRPRLERELTSQVYICCSYQALRMTNFMSQPSLETIQCFLIIGNVLSYNMNPGVAYILLGMALRMAFTLGLQTDSHQFSGPQQYLRRRVWWALAWQDSHFSMSYDRPSCSALYGPEIPYRRTSKPGFRSYAESMFRIIQLTQEIIKGRMVKPDANLTWGAIRSYKEEISRIVAEGAPHLRERNQCASKTQHLERLALKLHSSYITSELCRPALKESDPSEMDERRSSLPTSGSHCERSRNHGMSPTQTTPAALEALTTQLRRECIANLVLTIDAYLEVHSISQHAARSWIGIQRAISAAFLLGITQESHYDQQIRNLLRNLETVISERTKMDSTFVDATDLQNSAAGHPPANAYGDVDGGSHGRFTNRTGAPGLGDSMKETTSQTPPWPRPMTQSLKALSKLNGALATPRSGNVTHLPPAFPPSAMNPGSVAGMDQLWSGQFSPNNAALVMPATPESSGSGEWNYGNLGERAAEYVQPAIWG